jgi:hypothetical protein
MARPDKNQMANLYSELSGRESQAYFTIDGTRTHIGVLLSTDEWALLTDILKWLITPRKRGNPGKDKITDNYLLLIEFLREKEHYIRKHSTDAGFKAAFLLVREPDSESRREALRKRLERAEHIARERGHLAAKVPRRGPSKRT